jgi:hypothetical protein
LPASVTSADTSVSRAAWSSHAIAGFPGRAADETVPAGVEAAARNGNLTLTGAVQFGSDWPICTIATTHRAWLELVRSALDGMRAATPTVIGAVQAEELRGQPWRYPSMSS